MRFQNIAVKSSLYTNIVNPVVFALCQRMTCIWIHIWTGAYMLNLSIGDDPLLLVSRRQRSWMLLLSEIPEQENMQNFPKWVHYHYLMYQPALFIKSRWCACYVRISAGMQIRCQALSLPISMRFIFALQKWQWTHAPRLLSKRTLRHDLRFLWGSLFVCLFELKSDSCSSFFFRFLAAVRRELQYAAIVIPHWGFRVGVWNLFPSGREHRALHHPSWGAVGSTSSSRFPQEFWESSASADVSAAHLKVSQKWLIVE